MISNLAQNPSFETPPIYPGINATAEMSPEWALVGSRSLRVAPTGTSIDSRADFANHATPRGLERGRTYTMTATLRLAAAHSRPSGNTVRSLFFYVPNTSQYIIDSAPGQPGVYPLRITFTVPASGDWHLRLYNGGAVGEPAVWFDGMMLVEGAQPATYADGDSLGWAWLGTPHASVSRGPALGTYTPEAELLRTGSRVDWIDLVPGFEESATAGTSVQVTADPTREPYVTVRPGRDARGTLTMHFVRETGKGRPGDRAEAAYRSLSSGAPHTLRMLDPHAGLVLLELVPCGVIRRDRQARSDGAWTVEFDFHRVVRPT